jgi:Cu/Ag efflux pump CusA
MVQNFFAEVSYLDMTNDGRFFLCQSKTKQEECYSESVPVFTRGAHPVVGVGFTFQEMRNIADIQLPFMLQANASKEKRKDIRNYFKEISAMDKAGINRTTIAEIFSQLSNIGVQDGASTIYREGGSRYIAIKYSVRGRDLGSAVQEAMAAVNRNIKLPPGYRLDWAGEYESAKRAQRRLALIVPLTILVIFLELYSAFDSFKWAGLVLLNVARAPVGGVAALLLTGTHFSVSSGVGFLALFGVSVQIGLIMVVYINQLRARGHEIADAALEGAVRRLRPIMMTMLVAMLGLLPAALSHDIGSDSQRPFAIVIVGGLIGVLFICILLLPTLYVWFAGSGDRLGDMAMED